MKSCSVRKLLAVSLLAIVAIIFVLALGFIAGPDSPASPNQAVALEPPSFLGVANAAPATESTAITSFLEDEAGIAAYTQTVSSIDLSIARTAFRTIEYETGDYIIGSVEVPDYPESHDVHVYVHTDGWVVAYYLAADPASKILDLRHYNGVEIASTKLENAMFEVLVTVGVVQFEPSYYDFRYPNATNLMLVVDALYDLGTDSFEINLPSDYTYYERSWNHALHQERTSQHSTLRLDGAEISSLDSVDWVDSWHFRHGALTPAQLPPAVFHTVQIELSGYDSPDGYGGIALVYQEVP